MDIAIPKLAVLISREEGYGVPGSVPTRNNNPGDLCHSPHSFHTADNPNGIGIIDNPIDGWEDLIRQLNLFVSDNPQITVRQAIYKYAPPSTNNSEGYLEYVCNGMPCGDGMLLSEALKEPGETIHG